jgi:cytoskeletal protein CcmA (bactofilin family)
MFSKSRINEPGPKLGEGEKPKMSDMPATKPSMDFMQSGSKQKAGTSVLSADLTVTGNLKTTGDIQVEGVVEGDIRAHLLTVGETATIRGEIVADDIVVNGRVVGRVRGLKVRLTSTARVEGDIIHKTIAIESGAHFEGSVQRQEDPLAGDTKALPSMGRGTAQITSDLPKV